MIKSHYGQYLEEREKFEIVEAEQGFATYQITGERCYMRDVFIEKKWRRKGMASMFTDAIAEIAKAHGCKDLITTVVPSGKGSTESIKTILSYGFRLLSSQNDFIIFVIDL